MIQLFEKSRRFVAFLPVLIGLALMASLCVGCAGLRGGRIRPDEKGSWEPSSSFATRAAFGVGWVLNPLIGSMA